MRLRAAPVVLREVWHTEITDCVAALAWAPAVGRWRKHPRLAAAAVNGPITIFDGHSGQCQAPLVGHGFGTTSISWRPDGECLASAGQDAHIRLWEPERGEALHVLPAGAAWAEHVAWSPKGEVLASAAGRHLRLWTGEGAPVHAYPEQSSTIHAIAWQPGVNRLASAAYGAISIFDPARATAERAFQWKGASLKLAWSPDGRYLATGDQDSTVHFWYSQTGKDLQMWGYATKVRELSWDRTSRFLATGGGPDVIVWDCAGKGPEGTTPIQLRLHEPFVSALAYQRTGALLASAGLDGRVALWQPMASTRPLSTTVLGAPVVTLAWSPDDQHLAIGTEAGAVHVLTVSQP